MSCLLRRCIVAEFFKHGDEAKVENAVWRAEHNQCKRRSSTMSLHKVMLIGNLETHDPENPVHAGVQAKALPTFPIAMNDSFTDRSAATGRSGPIG